jgi:hypothetical protein
MVYHIFIEGTPMVKGYIGPKKVLGRNQIMEPLRLLLLLLGNMPVRCTGRENSYHDSAQPGEKTHITTRRNAYSITFCLIQLSFLVLVFQITFVLNLF